MSAGAGNIVKFRLISRCLGEIYAYIPQWGEYYSSINKDDAGGATVRSRKPAYVWGHYIDGICHRALKLCDRVSAGELPTGRMELCGNVCRWDTAQGMYRTSIDGRGHAAECEHRDIYGAVGCLIRGTNAAMEARLESYDEKMRGAK